MQVWRLYITQRSTYLFRRLPLDKDQQLLERSLSGQHTKSKHSNTRQTGHTRYTDCRLSLRKWEQGTSRWPRKIVVDILELKKVRFRCLLMLWLSFFWRSLASARKSTTPPVESPASEVDSPPPPAPNSVPDPLRSKSTKTESMDPRWWWWWWWWLPLERCELLRNGWWQGDEVGDVIGEVSDEGGPEVNPDPDPFNPASW